MSKIGENAKLLALQEALQFKNDPKMRELMEALKYGGKKWGNILYEEELEQRARETPAERAAREANTSAKFLKLQMEGNVARKKARFMTKTGLRHIAKKCKWECQGEKCWAHEAATCPFIHKGEPGWNASAAVSAKAAGAGEAASASGKKRRQATRNRRQATRRQATRRRRNTRKNN
jgi:hypothetical protein